MEREWCLQCRMLSSSFIHINAFLRLPFRNEAHLPTERRELILEYDEADLHEIIVINHPWIHNKSVFSSYIDETGSLVPLYVMIPETEQYGDVFNNEYFRFPRRLLIGIGHWPYSSRPKKYLFRFLIIGLLLNGNPFMIKEFMNRWAKSKSASMHCIPPFLTQALCLIKFANFAINESQIRTLLSRTYENWKYTETATERNMLLSYGEFAKHTSRLYAGCLYIAMVFFLLIPLAPAMLDMIMPLNASRPKHLVFPIDYGDPMENHYILKMFHAYIGAFSAVTIIVASDVFFINLIFHACYLFGITRYWLEHLDDDIMDYTAENLRISKLNEFFGNSAAIKVCVRRVAYGVICHNKALKYSAHLENTYTWSLFVILGINMLTISLTGFQVLTQKDQWDDVLICLTYIFGQLCHLFLLSLPGQLLIDESGSIHDSINKSYNFEVPVKAQKMLIPILIRSMYPSKITAGKFYVLEMETFLSVIQASASYFTVLANMN